MLYAHPVKQNLGGRFVEKFDTSHFKQGKIVAKLLPTEERLRHACMRKVPQSFQSKTKFQTKSSPQEKGKEKGKSVTVVFC